MSIPQRQYIRFSLDLRVRIYDNYGQRREAGLTQVSIGGCFIDWDDEILVGDEFRMEMPLPDGNFLPLACKAIYRFEDMGIGIKFLDISQFEQQFISKIIEKRLEDEGVPLQIDPFNVPPRFINEEPSPRVIDIRQKRDLILERIMSADGS